MRWIVLLRGINVGGAGRLPMADLRAALADAGAENVQSLIASGNLVFDLGCADAAEVGAMVGDVIDAGFGFRPDVMALRPEAVAEALAAQPFPDADGKAVHLVFPAQGIPEGAVPLLAGHCTDGEAVAAGAHCLYVHYPNGSGRSKLAGRIERALGGPATARNLNTVRRLSAMAKA